MKYFKNRKNKRREGGISIAHINKQKDVLNKLSEYLLHTGKSHLIIKLRYDKGQQEPKRTVLTFDQIMKLYGACEDNPIGKRDRAMLSIYYGCGLRKSEGLKLELQDISLDRKLLYVRETKNNYDRYVPMSDAVIRDLEDYLYESRTLLLSTGCDIPLLFVSEQGNAMSPETMFKRLQALKHRTADTALQEKSFGLHALRHSIATHLLQAGVELEYIARFLGHKSLDSTQIYTHIINTYE